MIPRLTIATALLGSLVVLLSQVTSAYSLDDPLGVSVAEVSLLSKHGPTVAILGLIAGLAGVFLLTVQVREPSAVRPVARGVGIIVGGMGIAVILVFFLVDLPDVGSTGMFDAPGAGNLDVTGSATAGLWVELVGGVILLLAGVALAVSGPKRSDSETSRG